MIAKNASSAAYRKRTPSLIGRVGAVRALKTKPNLKLCVRAKFSSPINLEYNLPASAGHDFEPIADEFSRQPLRD